MNNFLKGVVGISLVSSVGSAALVSADIPMDYRVVSEKLSAEEECMEACSLLGKDFYNLDYQDKVRKAFAKVKEKEDICQDYFYNERGNSFGKFDIYDVYDKYGDLRDRLHSLKAPWWTRTRRDFYDISLSVPIIDWLRSKSQEEARKFIIKLDKEGPSATHMNLWYS